MDSAVLQLHNHVFPSMYSTICSGLHCSMGFIFLKIEHCSFAENVFIESHNLFISFVASVFLFLSTKQKETLFQETYKQWIYNPKLQLVLACVLCWPGGVTQVPSDTSAPILGSDGIPRN